MTPNNSAPLRHESGTSSKLTPEIQGFLSENSKKFLWEKASPWKITPISKSYLPA